MSLDPKHTSTDHEQFMDEVISAAFIDHPDCFFKREVTLTLTIAELSTLQTGTSRLARASALLLARCEITKILKPEKKVPEAMVRHLGQMLKQENDLNEFLLKKLAKESEKLTDKEEKAENEMHRAEEVAIEATRARTAQADSKLDGE